MSKNKNKKPTSPGLPDVDRYMHCGMQTETAAGEDTVYCSGCHAWLKTSRMKKVDEKGVEIPGQQIAPEPSEDDEEIEGEEI